MTIIRVRVKADSRKERFVEVGEALFEVYVKEKAEGNQANIRVRELVATHFGVLVAQTRIEAGHHSPQKRIHIAFTKNGA